MQFIYSCRYQLGGGRWKSFERTFAADSIEAGVTKGRAMLSRSVKYQAYNIHGEKLLEAGA